MTHRESQTLAYHRIRDNGLLSRLRFLVYEAIYKHQGEDGVTSGELDRIISRDVNAWTRSASPRLGELVDLGTIEELPLRPCRETGQTVIAYRTTGELPNPDGLHRVRPFDSKRCAIAMAKLFKRIVAEGYVREDHEKELLDRARNMEHGRGFITDEELWQQQQVEDLLA